LQPESNTPIHHKRKRTKLSQTQSKGGYYIQQDETPRRRRRRRQGLLPPAPKLQNSEAATPNSKKIHSTGAPEETGSPRDVEDGKEVKKKGKKHRKESMMVHELLLPALPQRSTSLLSPFHHSQTKRHGRAGTGDTTGPAIFLPGPEFALAVDSLLQIFRNRSGPGSFSDRDRPAIDRQPGFPHLVHTWELAPVRREHADRSFFQKKSH
jgi:hypothetical protein